jgi:hypothetical protein
MNAGPLIETDLPLEATSKKRISLDRSYRIKRSLRSSTNSHQPVFFHSAGMPLFGNWLVFLTEFSLQDLSILLGQETALPTLISFGCAYNEQGPKRPISAQYAFLKLCFKLPDVKA